MSAEDPILQAERLEQLVHRLRKMSMAVYLAADEGPAADLSDGLTQAADAIAALLDRLRQTDAKLREQAQQIEQLIAEWKSRAETESNDTWCNTADAPIWRSIHKERASVYLSCAAELERALLPASRPSLKSGS